MAKKNIQMKHSNEGVWDELYPVTLSTNVFDENGQDMETKKANQNDLETTEKQTNQNTTQMENFTPLINGGDFTTVSEKNIVSTAVIIDDDGRRQLYDILFPILLTRGIKISSALVTSRIGNEENTITLEEMLEMKDSGLVNFVSHGDKHIRYTDHTLEEVEEDLKLSKQFLSKHGINTSHFVYPFGAVNNEIRQVVSKYFKSASKSNGLTFSPTHEIMDSLFIPRVNFEEDLTTIEARIDEIVENDGLIVFNVHSQYPEFTTQKFEAIIDMLESKGVRITDIETAYKDFSNLLELRNGSNLRAGVSANGIRKHGITDFTIQHPARNMRPSIDSPPDFYDFMNMGAITLSNNEYPEWGFDDAGILITLRPYNDDYTTQFYLTIRSNQMFRRSWLTSSPQGWTNFKPVATAPTHVRNIGPYDIDIGSVQSFTITTDIIREGCAYTITPQFPIEPWIIPVFHVVGIGEGVVRFYNLDTTRLRTLQQGDWVLSRIDN